MTDAPRKQSQLSRHTEDIVRMKYAGITNVEIAKQLGISDERVRQIWLFWLRRSIIRGEKTLKIAVEEEEKTA